jgi:ferredoxin-NADP reductase
LPPQRREQVVYGALVGVVFASQVHVGPVTATPELALILGNIYSYAVSPKYKLRLRLRHKRKLAPNIYDFAFEPDRKPQFKPGQYLDWTLPHANVDERGNRRSFSIASAPDEPLVHIGVKFYKPSSSFKQALRALEPGDTLVAGGLAGDFVLPDDPTRKLAFIAGGIGITPFSSMLAHLVETGETRDIVLFYLVSNPAEAVYDDVLDKAEFLGVRVVRVSPAESLPAGWEHLEGPLTPAFLRKHLPHYDKRTVYISGPNAMVVHCREVARQLRIPPERIVTDYFAGY